MAETSVIEKAAARVRERLPEDQQAHLESFVRQYWAWVPDEDLRGRSELDVYGAALAHWNLAHQRAPGSAVVRVYNPSFEDHGWQTTHTVVEIVTDDMPFLVDSVSMVLNRHGYGIHLMVHPVVRVRRDDRGRLCGVVPAGSGGDDSAPDAFIHAEVDRQTEIEELDALRDELLDVLRQVSAAVEDWPKMLERMAQIRAELGAHPPPVSADELEEAKAFLEWLEDDHFTFLGYREYDLVEREGHDALCSVPGSGLGILREGGQTPRSFANLPPEARKLAREPHVLTLTKANTRATVHRPAYLDYIGIKKFDAAGQVSGELRFLGLYTSVAYNTSPREIPVLRHKVAQVLERSGFPPRSHSEKDLLDILETYPRDELFQMSAGELFDFAMAILHLGQRQRVRLLVRNDVFGRFLSCLVFLPLDRYNTENRERIEAILLDAFDGRSADFSSRVSESVLARLHYIIHAESEEWPPHYDVHEIEGRIVDATRSWKDDLYAALVEERGEELGTRLFRRYGDAFSPAYRAAFVARTAVVDIARLEELPEEGFRMSLYHPLEAPAHSLRLKLYKAGEPVSLSQVLPMLENMGVEVTDERPYEVDPRGGAVAFVYDFGLTYAGDGGLETDRVKGIFQDTLARVWRGEAENDGFNRLALRARLDWRAITVLRAYAKYLRQTGSPFSQEYMERSLSRNPQIARLLIELFRTRLDPGRRRDEDASQRLVDQLGQALDAVESLDEDRILRSFLNLTQATLRTNFFQAASAGELKPYLSLKLDSARIPELPLPRPMFEIFVYSPRMEGVHLRGGKVARGGIRWSDRPEDFRTEILGLMKAQMVKNAVIVPVGAKGGFVVKRPPSDGGREALMEEVVHCYRTLIRGMLDLTDNLVDGTVRVPDSVVRYDDDDPYLVVAADKGTATFSDIANGIAADLDFWLGDAFASGGSTGYDHKQMGITARGAWESVRRHFRGLAIDVQSTDFTAVGIGDMSGDVFGNGMLLSRHLKLIGAFNHQHVFLDPDPDAEASYRERRRLFELPRSSWADYDLSVISEGGGVYSRAAKAVKLSPQTQRALGLERESVSPNDLIRALLRAPVDLLWNGGIGTYVKAGVESHADVGDRTNDAVRIDAGELRCRVVGEGGNLGLTQRARIEYALNGGRINTDFIDNSGGVDCSDHEVNIKILLNAVVADGDMTEKQRNELLAEMTDEVARLVLRDNYGQAQGLALARAQAAALLDVHDRFMRDLEHAGKLNRGLEFLPDEEAIAERKAAGLGLTTPELAVLQAYSKLTLYEELLESDVPEDPYLSGDLERYFPPALSECCGDRMRAHRLGREIVATRIVNSMVNRMGITFPFRLREETGAGPADIARVYTVAREVFDIRDLWEQIKALDDLVPEDAQVKMLLEARKLLERSSRWLLRNRARPLEIAATLEQFRPGARALMQAGIDLLPEADREAPERRAEGLAAAGVPPDLARHVAGLGVMFSTWDIVDVARGAQLPVEAVADLYFELGSRLQLLFLRDQITALPRDNRWQSMARAALRGDLYSAHSALAAQVLRAGPPELPIERRIDAWIGERSDRVERWLQMLTELRTFGKFDFTTLSVALREIRSLIESSVPPSSGDGAAPQRPAGMPASRHPVQVPTTRSG